MKTLVPESVLIIGPDRISEAVMGLPALQLYRQEYPEVNITLLTGRKLAPLWAMHAAPDAVLAQGGRRRTVRELKSSVYSRAFILPRSFRSAWLACAAGLPRRIGAAGHGRQLLLTERVHLGAGHRQFEYMNILGVQGEPPAPRLQVPHDAFRSLERKLHHLPNIGRSMCVILQALEAERADGSRPVITLLPGTAGKADAGWPKERFVALARRLWQELDAVVVLSGGPDKTAVCEEISKAAGDDVLNLAGQTTLQEWAALLKISDCVVSDDSGGMHLAAALGTPVAAIFGPADPEKTGPLGKSIVLQNIEIQGRKGVSRAARNTFKRVFPDDAYTAVKRLLNG